MLSHADEDHMNFWELHYENDKIRQFYKNKEIKHGSKGNYNIVFNKKKENKALIYGVDEIVKIHDMNTGEQDVVKLYGDPNCAIRWTPDNNNGNLIMGFENGTIAIMDLETKEIFRVLCDYMQSIYSLKLSEKNQQLVVCHEDGCIKLWCLKKFKCLKTFQENQNNACDLCFLNYQETFFISNSCCESYSYIEFWDTELDKSLAHYKLLHRIKGFIYSLDLKLLICIRESFIIGWKLNIKKGEYDKKILKPKHPDFKISNPFKVECTEIQFLESIRQTRLLVSDCKNNIFIVDLSKV